MNIKFPNGQATTAHIMALDYIGLWPYWRNKRLNALRIQTILKNHEKIK